MRHALEFASASVNPNAPPLVVDSLLSDWASLTASPGCISGLVELISPKLQPTAKMSIIFEAMASLKDERAVTFAGFPVESAGAYTMDTVREAELGLSKLEFSFTFKQSHDGAAAASAVTRRPAQERPQTAFSKRVGPDGMHGAGTVRDAANFLAAMRLIWAIVLVLVGKKSSYH